MITKYRTSENFDMMVLETVSNQYLGEDTSFTCSPDLAAKVDEQVLRIIRKAHEKAYRYSS